VLSLAVTETFKQKKQQLAAQGFDPERIADALYADDGDAYVPLDGALYARISSGLLRF
jgi:fatty-acyl-CoA synthase